MSNNGAESLVTSNGNNDGAPTGFSLKTIFRGHQETINQLAWSPDGEFLASVGDDAKSLIWQVGESEPKFVLEKHVTPLYAVAWSPDGSRIATGSYGPSIRVWDTSTGKVVVRFRGHHKPVYDLLWQDMDILLSASADNTVRVWDIKNGRMKRRPLKFHSNRVLGLDMSPNEKAIASASKDKTIRLWKPSSGEETRMLNEHTKGVNCVKWSPDGKTLVSGSDDGTLRVWSFHTGRSIRIIESSAAVTSISFSSDGEFLASSCADDTIQIWRCDQWHLIASFIKPDSYSWRSCAIFNPKLPLLATLSEGDKSIYIWEYDVETLRKIEKSATSINYANAKVVLLGDTGVGKSGLGMVLAGENFAATESTHGRRVWTLDRQSVQLSNGEFETRETVLWDLAGQPGYRLVHQLHLNEVTVALLLFDARSEVEPFAGVKYWDRALNQALRIQGTSALPLTKFLVAARSDRGGAGVSKHRIEALTKELGITKYFETSAKEGWGVDELSLAIKNSIDWSALAKVSSNRLFQSIKSFLIDKKESGLLLAPQHALYDEFLRSTEYDDAADLVAQFNMCIGRVESRGLIRKLSFGNLVLLQPELLDAYASALVNAARDEPDGMGSISEDVAHKGNFKMSDDERIDDAGQEKLLVIATIEDMLKQELVLREHSIDGVYLVFPSQFTRENPDLPAPEGQSVIFHFEGPVFNIYTTLVVRLTHSVFFENKEMWKNAVIFSATAGGECGLFLHYEGDGIGELTLFYDSDCSQQTRIQFEEYVRVHLARRVAHDKLHQRRIHLCPKCKTPVPQRHIEIRKQKGFSSVLCSVCYPEDEILISIVDDEEIGPIYMLEVEAMDQAADAQRDLETAKSVLLGKIETSDYDVFLCHNTRDKSYVKQIGNDLKGYGILPWLDEWELRPGLPWQKALEEQIDRIKSVAVFIGENGIGPWQDMEQMAFVRQFVKRAIPIIPIILPNCGVDPQLPVFLEGMTWVDFRRNDPEPLQQLIWGVTGDREYIISTLKANFDNGEKELPDVVEVTSEQAMNVMSLRMQVIDKLSANRMGTLIVIVKSLSLESLLLILDILSKFDQPRFQLGDSVEEELVATASSIIKNLTSRWRIERLPKHLRSISSNISSSGLSLDVFERHYSAKLALPIIFMAIENQHEYRLAGSDDIKSLIEKTFDVRL